MKKLMIAAAIVCVAAISQAATASWSTPYTTFPDQPDDSTKYNFQWAILESTTATDFSDVTFDGKTIGGLGEGQKATAFTTPAPIGYGDGQSGSLTGSAGNYYALIVYEENLGLYGVSDAVVAALDPSDDQGNTLKKMQFVNGDWDGEAAMFANKPTAVPEPTTGLLMLLGMAGLALRRRRA